MAFDELAQKLFGAKRAESNAVLTDATTGTIHGTALSDSADGSVLIEVTGDVTTPDEVDVGGEPYYADAGVGIEVPTSESVKAGDEVLVSVYGEGILRSPVVTASIGSGDRVAGMAQDAYDLADSVEGIAQQALAVAEATGQHFWDDDNGAHVTELPREEWEAQQTGPNSLWNSLGMLFRNGLNNLLAILPSSTVTDSFTTDAESASSGLVCNLTKAAQSIASVTVDGTAVASSYYGMLAADVVNVSYEVIARAGQTVEIEYVAEPSLEFFDGAGNLIANITATFSASIVSLASGFFRFKAGIERSGSRTGSIYIGAGADENAEIRLTTDSLYDRAYIAIEANSPSGMAAIIIDTGSSLMGTGSSLDLTSLDSVMIDYKEVPLSQAYIALTRPMATWTGTSGTVTDGAGWHQTDFNTMLAQHGPWSDYFTLSGGRITALKDVTLQLTMDLSWNDNIMGIRGAGFFKNSSVGSGVNEISSFSAKGANNRFYCVFPPRLISLSAGEYLNIGRYNQLANSIFTRGTNYTWLTVEVIG